VITASAPVLVISRGYTAGGRVRGGAADLAIARTLGRLGVSLYLVAQQGMSTPSWSSRYWAKRIRWDFSRPETESVAFLLAAGASLESAHQRRAILLTGSDWAAIFVERNRHLLADRFDFPQPVQPVIDALANKWKLHLLASEHQIPTPMTMCPASQAEVEASVERIGFPLVMKAADPYVADPPLKTIFYSHKELIREVERQVARRALNLILQEYIPGDVDTVWMCNGYFGLHSGQTVIFTGKKLRQASPTAIASLAICLPNETVATQTRGFMEGVGYQGCVGIGFRYDCRDGRYKLLDVNARVSGVFRLFAGTGGMDVVRACYLDLTGQEVPTTALQPGRKWMREEDVVVAALAVRNGRLSVTEWMRSVRGVRELQWFARDDPMPTLTLMREALSRVALADLANADCGYPDTK
jgi:D-aspartate ligase